MIIHVEQSAAGLGFGFPESENLTEGKFAKPGGRPWLRAEIGLNFLNSCENDNC